MSSRAEPRAEDSVSAPVRLSGGVRRPWVAAAAAMLLLDLVFLVPGNPPFDLNLPRHRRPGMIFSHVAVLVLLVGLWPARQRALEAVARARPARRAAAIALAAALPIALVTVLGRPWPAFAHALCKEWGPIEPATVGTYLVGAWVSTEGARRRRILGRAWRPFRLAAILFVFLALEEIDYFGIPGAIIGGRIGRVYVGSLHDLANFATWYPAVLPALAAGALALVAVAWRVADVSLGFLWTEVRHVSSWVMILGALAIGAAEIVDITAEVPAGLERVYRADVEEPLELGGATLLAAGMLLKYCRDRGRSACDVR